MKKVLSLVLAALTVISCIPAFAGASDEIVNVAKGCSYVCDTPFYVEGQTSPGYHMVSGKELTDGIKGKEFGNTDWLNFHHSNPANKPDMQATIDLGRVYSNIVVLDAYFCAGTWGIVLPTSVKFAVSTDGVNFTQLGTATKTLDFANGDMEFYDYIYYPKNFVTARYVKIIVSGSGMNFISEVEVFTGDEVQDGYIDDFYVKDRQYVFVSGEYLKGLPEKTSYADALAQFNSADGITVKDENGKEKTSGYICTGDTFTKRKKKVDDLHYTFVIDGDLNGDGKADARDYGMLKRHCLGTYTVSGVELVASDVNHDGNVTAKDYLMLKRYALGTYDIYEDYGPSDGRGFVTEKWVGKVNTEDNIQTLTSWDMTIKRTSDVQYTFYYKAEGGDMTFTFHRTPWGTWNLGAWSLVDAKGNHRFTTESTDWEYVYRVASSASGAVTFSGGNHANEKLREIHLYDQDGKELNLALNQSASVTKVTIVEKTNLYWDPAGDDGKYNYKDSDIYAQAQRTYTICGPQMTLAVDYEYLKDTYYLMSYNCMFPINKEYGLYMASVSEDNELMKVCETLKTNPNPYGNIFYETPKATRAIIWGYGANADYKFDIRVLTKDSCIGSDGILRFWDMNTTDNKLYFAMYPAGGTKTKVDAGSQRHTEVQWNFYK